MADIAPTDEQLQLLKDIRSVGDLAYTYINQVRQTPLARNATAPNRLEISRKLTALANRLKTLAVEVRTV